MDTPDTTRQASPGAKDVSTARNRSRDKALLIAAQYNDAASLRQGVNPLQYSHKDVQLLKEYLVDYEGYSEDRIVVLEDNQDDPSAQPTKINIVRPESASEH